MKKLFRHVFRWDLDKTYLRSEFSTLKDLIKTGLETAYDKRTFPGASALMRSLRSSPENAICIISGSPVQMRSVLSAKLALDGVEFDEFVLKNNLGNIARFRFRALKAQIPYKLPALIKSRLGLIGSPAETLVGDDSEADAIVYCLYADLVAGIVSKDELTSILEAARAYDDQKEETLALAACLTQSHSIGRILIHLDRRSPLAHFWRFGPRLVPIYNYLQAAAIFHMDGHLTPEQMLFVAKEMVDSEEFEISTLATSLQDIVRRGRVDFFSAQTLAQTWQKQVGGSNQELANNLGKQLELRLAKIGVVSPPEWNETGRLDYVSLVDEEYLSRHTKKSARR